MPTFIDFTGKKIGRVKVLHLIEKRSGGTYWHCQCDCKHVFNCWSANFRRGDKFECKLCILERRRGIDLTGRKYGRWTVISREIDSHGKTQWKCLCDCGVYGLVSSYSLGKPGRSQSCGCLGRKKKSKFVNTTLYPPSHGLSKDPFYQIKTSLIHKCYTERHPSYPKFGAKGITVCDLWRNGVKDMHEWAVSNGWQKGDVIVLKDGQKEFNPTTCYIIPESEFISNHASKRGFQISYNGETHSVLKWAKLLNVNHDALRKKLKSTPSIEEVFSSKFRKFHIAKDPELIAKAIDLYNSGKTQKELAKLLNLKAQSIRYHLIKADIELRPEDRKREKRTDLNTEEIKKMREKGMSMNSIAEALNCSFPTIKNRLLSSQGISRDRSKG